jgi:predicted unusual protein kinase regulating ubiquinone biosynthesis (AarF/ABC1/UbiB family)
MTIADNPPGRGRSAVSVPSPHQRRVEIASILLKYGWDALIFRLSLVDFLPSGLKQRLAVSSFLRQEAESAEGEPDLALPLPSVLRQILEELGPTFVKLGQVLSTRADIIPQAYIDELAKLQEQVSPAPWQDMEQVLLGECNSLKHGSSLPLARSVYDVFPEFDTIPLAAGSLGQVYKAAIENERGERQDVIVKLLRPGIDLTIEADIAVMLEFARLLTARTNWGRWNNVIGLAEEFSSIIRNELDFTLEGSNTEIIGRNLTRDYGSLIKVPKIFWQHSSRRMLTVEFVTGAKVSTLFPKKNGEAPVRSLTLTQRQRLNQTLTVAFLRQIFVDGFFHADPHPGNVMFEFKDDQPDAPPTLVLIDFGMVGRLDPRSREILIDFLLAMLQFDAARATDRILEYGHPQQLIDKYRLTVEMDHLMREFLGRPVSEVQIGQLMNRVMELMLQYRVRMPTSFLMIARVLVTTEGICRQLDKDYMLINVAEPFILSLMQRQFTSIMSGPELMRIALDWKNVLLRTPRRIDDLLTAAASGQLRIEYEIRNLQRLERTMTVIGNKVAFSLLTAALIVGAALLAPIHNGPHIWGFHALSLFTFLTGGVLGIWLLISILRSGQLK